MAATIRVETHGDVVLAAFDNPPHGYMDPHLLTALDAFLDQLEQNASARVVVFAGAVPGAFIRHYDVAEIGRMMEDGGGEEIARMHRVYSRVAALPIPTIAAIDGVCLGGGLEFALCCDLRLASAGAGPFGFPECSIGIFPATGGTQRAPRLIGEAKALELMLTGRLLDAEEALRIGLLNRIVDDARPAALKLAGRLASMPRGGLAEIKHLVRLSGTVQQEADGLAEERKAFSQLLLKNDETRQRLKAHLS